MRFSALCFATSVASSFAAVPVINVQGGGGSNPSKYIWKIADKFTREARVPINFGYRTIGSRRSQYEQLGCQDETDCSNGKTLNDFGSGDTGTPTAIWNEINKDRSFLQIPFALGAIGIFYNDQDGLIGDVNLPACVLAKIFSTQITSWDHPEIGAANPGKTLPNIAIKVVHRTSGSSSTAGTTQYLKKATDADHENCPEAWPSGQADLTITWPEGTLEASSSGVMTSTIMNTVGAIGYLDAGHGKSVGLPEAKLQSGSGDYLLASEADVSAAGDAAIEQGDIFPAQATGDWASVSLIDLKGPNVWPITLIMYIYVMKDLSGYEDIQQASLVKFFCQYVLSDEGQAMAEDPEFGFSGVPPNLRKLSQTAADSIILPDGAISWTQEFKSAQVIDGAGQYVISYNRHNYVELRTGENTKSIDALQAQVDALGETQGAQSSESSTNTDRNSGVDNGLYIITGLQATVSQLQAQQAQAAVTIATLQASLADAQREIDANAVKIDANAVAIARDPDTLNVAVPNANSNSAGTSTAQEPPQEVPLGAVVAIVVLVAAVTGLAAAVLFLVYGKIQQRVGKGAAYVSNTEESGMEMTDANKDSNLA